MTDFDIFFENAGSSLEVMGSLPSSYFHRFPGVESFIIATGIRYADENWAWIKSGSYSRELLIEVIEKFKKKSLQFIWPVFPDSDIQMWLDMDELGLLTRKIFGAMIFDFAVDLQQFDKTLAGNVAVRDAPQGVPLGECEHVSADLKLSAKRAFTPEDALLWAVTCWKGFTESETGKDVPPEFVSFAQNAVLNDKLRLVLGYIEKKPIGTFMLCKCDGIFISHFTVLTEWRNLGAGSFLMNELMNYSSSIKNRYLVLIATAAGERLYKKFGFRRVADIPIRSFSEDV